MSKVRVGLVVLGCDKNTVDSEYLAASLARRGALVTSDPVGDGPVDAVVIATCGFTGEARRQSIATIREWAKRKTRAPLPLQLYVWSCMGQRWADELLAAIPQIDGIAGVGRFEQLAAAILSRTSGKRQLALSETAPSTQHSKLVTQHDSFPPGVRITARLARLRLDRRPYAFLKISDGCNHRCSFCAIPLMKGPLRSVPRRILLDEARALIDSGAREINLIAQDISSYGTDLCRNSKIQNPKSEIRNRSYGLPNLLEDILALEGDFWVRLLYVYPGGLNERLIELLAQHPKLCPYLDLPLQHLDVGVLRRMRRPQPGLDIERLVGRLRERIPDLALRTTMMVGFPNEDRAAFERLLAGVGRIRFDRLGAFTFSPEEGTAAAAMADCPSRRIAQRRLDRLMRFQAAISAELAAGQIGRTVRVLVESAGPASDEYVGRTARDAPEVDGLVRIHSRRPLQIGSFAMVKITTAETYDLVGEAV